MTPFTRTHDGDVEFRIGENEAGVLREMFGTLELALTEGESSDALRRLFPPAYPEDVEAQAEFASMTYDDLVTAKREAIVRCVASLDAAKREKAGRRRDPDVLVTTLDGEHQEAWLRTLNDLRLFVGTRLGVTEDVEDTEPHEDDPAAFAKQVYLYLGWLQQNLVEMLLD